MPLAFTKAATFSTWLFALASMTLLLPSSIDTFLKRSSWSFTTSSGGFVQRLTMIIITRVTKKLTKNTGTSLNQPPITPNIPGASGWNAHP